MECCDATIHVYVVSKKDISVHNVHSSFGKSKMADVDYRIQDHVRSPVLCVKNIKNKG